MQVRNISPDWFHWGSITYEEKPNIILIVNLCCDVIFLTKLPRLIWSVRFSNATEVSLLIIDGFTIIQNPVPCQLAYVMEMSVWQFSEMPTSLPQLSTHSTSWKISPPRNCIL